MDNQCLEKKRLYKPTGMKQGCKRWIRVCSGTIIKQHDETGRFVENGTDWTDKDEKATQLTDGSFVWPGQSFSIHLVGLDGGLRKIVQQVICQHMDRHHGYER
jgi:hypothetical protein